MKTKLMRLQKFLANSGIDSRRKCENLIQEGHVRVNGKVVTELGFKIDPDKDRVNFDGKSLKPVRKFRTIMLNKPRGYECTTAANTKNIYELLKNIRERLVPAGRLDKISEGLLILSNDTRLIQKLTHPSFLCQKIYRVMVSGDLTPDMMQHLRDGVDIGDYVTRPAKVTFLRMGEKPGRKLLEFVLTEGKKRQIRLMCDAVGLEVHRLTRIQINGLLLRDLTPGHWKDLTEKELKLLTTPMKGEIKATEEE